MEYLVNSLEMKSYDKNTSEYYKIPSIVLMERAAEAFADALEQERVNMEKTLIVCGVGNNGGDGLAIARMLMQRGCDVTVVLVGNPQKATESNRLQQEILAAYQVPVFQDFSADETYTAVVDAMFGVGLTRNPEGEYARLIEKMNQTSGVKAAVDISSGISTDDGRVMGIAFRADITVTFAFAKIGMVLWPGNEYSGKIIVKDIGIDERSFLGKRPAVSVLTEQDVTLLPGRRSHSNKGTYGRVLIVAGSVGMAGAAVLSAKAAYAAGSGLVRVFTPEENRVILQTAVPEAILTTYDKDNLIISVLKEAVSWADAVVLGPGIGKSETALICVREVLVHAAVPVIADADALNLIAEHKELLNDITAELIMTPHLGEMARLSGVSVSEIQSSLIQTAETYARDNHVICVLKDEHTVTCIPNGRIYVNCSGNAGMATAGSGDVLSGVIGSLAGQGMSPEDAAPFGVYLHGKAGDIGQENIGQHGLTASDLVDGVKLILKDWEKNDEQL